MRILSASVAAAGVAIMLSGCAHYSDDPDYGPPPSYDRGPPDAPPPQGDYGPPPQGNYGPPPQSDYGTPPPDNYGPQGGYDGAPPNGGPDHGYGPQGGGPDDSDAMSNGSESKADKAMRHINNPKWCAKHQQKCDKLRGKYGAPDQSGYQDQQGYQDNQSGYPNQPGY